MKLELSKIILGTWAIGGSSWGGTNEKEAAETIDACFETGVTAIDTAPAYGNGKAEEIIGKAVKGRREKIIIATKCGLDMEAKAAKNLSPSFIEKDLNNSLRRLGTDYIDLYQCHWPDPNIPLSETMGALMRFKQDGKILHIGVCNFNASQIEEAAKYAPLFSYQPQYSLLERGIDKDELPLCTQKGIKVITYGSLGGGLLSGKYTASPSFEKSDARSFFYKFFKEKYWNDVNQLLGELRAIANKKGSEPGHVALAWALSRTGVSSVIAGARNSKQFLDNMKALSVQLSSDEMNRLDKISMRVYEVLSA
jgi:aryl-alcohol dehydrogenase-like predicted oxidoreductase